MNWKLILQLSMFGLAMGLATVFLISPTIEPLFWLAIFVICAWILARRTHKPFVHGLLLGLANSVWITAAHVLFFDRYLAHHPQDTQAMQWAPVAPRLLMVVIGPVVGLISGLIIGFVAFFLAKFVKREGGPAAA
jgi:hypothetical protein